MHSIDPGSITPSAILVADGDVAVLALASSALSQAGYVVLTARDSAEAIRLAESEPRPNIIILDWGLAGTEVGDFCNRVRGSGANGYTYIIALAAHARRADAVAALETGADEYMMKPFAVEELVARVGWVQRMLAAVPNKARRLRSLIEKAAHSDGGEVVINKGETVGRVYVHNGEIIWAYISTIPVTITSLFKDVKEITQDEVNEVLEEARRNGLNFVEVLVLWGFVTQDEAKRAIRHSIRQAIDAMFLLEDPEVVFAPSSRGGWRGPRFSLEEVIRPSSPASVTSSGPPVYQRTDGEVRCQFMPRCNVCAQMVPNLSVELRESGADGVTIVHRTSGAVLAAAGERIDQDFLRAALHVLGVLSNDDEVDEVLVSGAGRHYLLRATACPDALVSMMATRGKIGLGTIRHELSRFASRLVPDETVRARRRSLFDTGDQPISDIDSSKRSRFSG
jgi:CheY-like chemotaxis protein